MGFKTEKVAPVTRHEVEQALVSEVAGYAKKAFAEHRVTCLWHGIPQRSGELIHAGSWLCGKPDSLAYHFTIVSVPGRLMVFGDLGSLALERTYDMLAWARGSIESMEYFAEKVVREMKTKVFDPAMVRAYVHEVDQDILEGEHEYDDKTTKAWLTGLRQELLAAAEEGGEGKVYAVYAESDLYDGDMPCFENWDRGFLWCREAIKWFLNNHGV